MDPVRAHRRRWPRIVVGLVVLLLAAVAAWWYVWLPNWRPPLQAGERYGIDVSAHQDTIDWDGVAGDGITFAYIKASEGGDWTDERFQENWEGAAAAGLDRGAYHFFTLCTPGADQARQFLEVAPPDSDALPPALDVELGGNCSERPDPEVIATEVEAFLEPVEAAWGVPVVLYVGSDFEERYPIKDRLDRPLWLFSLFGRPDHDRWWIWQLHGFASVEGVAGRVDLDLMRSRPAQAESESPSPSPAPTQTPGRAGAFTEDFSDADAGWPLGAGEGGALAEYVEGTYETTVGPQEGGLFQAPVTHDGDGGVVIRVEAERLEDHPGQYGGIWGLACGGDVQGGAFYEAVVQVSRGKGHPGLFGWEGDEPEVFRSAELPHEAVRPDEVNELELRCIPKGDAMSIVFWINGVEVARGRDKDPPPVDEWETGLFLDGSPLPEGHKTRLRFDNYEVTPIPP